MNKLPSIAEVYGGIEKKESLDAFTSLMNQPPKKEWIKTHPYIRNYKYLPIERIEFLLKNIFRSYKIEITGQGQSFNGVWVTVRVHYLHPVSGEWLFHDGIGAEELQLRAKTNEEKATEKETGQKFRVPFSTENINNGAIKMAYPLAKTVAVKDACDHFGRLFGSDLNRKDEMPYKEAELYFDETHPKWNKTIKALKAGTITIEQLTQTYSLTEEQIQTLKNYETV